MRIGYSDAGLGIEPANEVAPMRDAACRQRDRKYPDCRDASERRPRANVPTATGFGSGVLRAKTCLQFRPERLKNDRVPLEVCKRRSLQDVNAFDRILERRAQIARRIAPDDSGEVS